VVTDLSMPGMSGFHLARAISELRADLPVIVTSGYVRPEDREAASHVGVRELVLKPNTVEELAQVLQRVFDKR
jgi:CheY-like chemotaxis protein